MNPGQGDTFPKHFDTPNFYTDDLDYYLKPTESKVLWRIMREILGWYDKRETRQNVICLSIIVDGRFYKDTGERQSLGCGLKRNAVQKALKSLCEYNIIKQVKKTPVGNMYELNFDSDSIQWNALEERKSKDDAKNIRRIKTAKEAHERRITQETEV
jgi:hypothetical protein